MVRFFTNQLYFKRPRHVKRIGFCSVTSESICYKHETCFLCKLRDNPVIAKTTNLIVIDQCLHKHFKRERVKKPYIHGKLYCKPSSGFTRGNFNILANGSTYTKVNSYFVTVIYWPCSRCRQISRSQEFRMCCSCACRK